MLVFLLGLVSTVGEARVFKMDEGPLTGRKVCCQMETWLDMQGNYCLYAHFFI